MNLHTPHILEATAHLYPQAIRQEYPCYFLRGIVPKPWVTTPSPPEKSTALHYQQPTFPPNSHYFLDGSGGLFSNDPRLRRTGFAIVNLSTTAPFPANWALYGNVSGHQTTPRAELYALHKLLQLALFDGALHQPNRLITIYTDCQYVVQGFH